MQDIKEITKRVQHLYDHIPEGEYRTEVGWILKALTNGKDDEFDTEDTKSGPVKVPKKKESK